MPNNAVTGKPQLGRPKKFVDLELVEKLAHIQCTQTEIGRDARGLGRHAGTEQAFCGDI